MGKGRFFGSLVAVAAMGGIAAWGGGCGISNDQGISFRAIGWFQDGDGDDGETGQEAPLACSDRLTSFIGLENNMLQGIQVERVDLRYRVSASSLSIPNNSFALSFRLGPSSGQEPNPPRQFSEIVVVSSATIEFLNNNRNQLPEPPFGMVVTATAVGITDAGDEFRTNRIGYQVEWLGDEFCEQQAEPTPAG